MSTMTLPSPAAEQLSNGHFRVEERTRLLNERGMPELAFTQGPYAVYVSHANPVPIEGDGRPMAIPTSNVVPMTVPMRAGFMYPAYSNCAAIYPTATRGSFSSLNRRGSDELPKVESPTDDGSNDDSPSDGKVVQEVCRYFMRTGTCGYGDKCRYHHPQSAHRPKLNSMGYPQREAEHACPFYLKNGWCGFGATCKFNHPELPPLNVPATPLMPQILAPVQYSTMPPPPYSPAGGYPGVAQGPATAIMHWSMAPAGVPMNLPPQTGMYHPSYVGLSSWPIGKEPQPMLVNQRIYQKPGDSRQEAVHRRTSRESEDSTFSVVGRDVSFPRHHSGMEETKHVLMPMPAMEKASHVSVTTA